MNEWRLHQEGMLPLQYETETETRWVISQYKNNVRKDWQFSYNDDESPPPLPFKLIVSLHKKEWKKKVIPRNSA